MMGKATSDTRDVAKAVRGISQLGDVSLAAQDRTTRPRSAREDIVLYQNESVIRQMWAKVIAASGRKRGLIANLLGKVQSVLDKVAISLEDLNTYEVNEFTIKPVLKTATVLEAGVECEVKWNLRNEIDIARAVSILFSSLPVESASQLSWHIEKQSPNTSISDLVYVGKPVCIYGVEDCQRSTDEEFLLRDGKYSVKVLLNQGLSNLQSQLSLLENRQLYILGLVDCVQPLRIQAGAILLSNRAVLSVYKVA